MSWELWLDRIGNGIFLILRDVIVPLSWPLLIGAATFAFRSDLSKLLSRLKRAGSQGFELESEIQNRPEHTDTPGTISEEIFEKVGQEAAPGLQPWVTNIQNSVVETPALGEQSNLIKALAIANRRAFFESVLRIIYGTQIRAIGRLAQAPRFPDDLADLHASHLADAKEFGVHPIANWMGYLLRANLVCVENGRYQLTDYGRSFYDLFLESGFDPSIRSW